MKHYFTNYALFHHMPWPDKNPRHSHSGLPMMTRMAKGLSRIKAQTGNSFEPGCSDNFVFAGQESCLAATTFSLNRKFVKKQ
jgi:hypothetical protein